MNKVIGEFKLKKIKTTLAFAVSVFLILSLFFSLKISAWNVNSYQNRGETSNVSSAISTEQIHDLSSNHTNQDSNEPTYVYRDFTKYDDFFGEAIPANYHGIWAIENIIKVNSDGSAEVKEIWRCRASRSSGQTEVYVEKNFRELGFDEDSLNVRVRVGDSNPENILTEENLSPMEYVRDWDTSGSFDDKAYKYGINRVDSDGTMELCIGLSEYDTPMTYYISYKLANFFTEYGDGVVASYIRFINKDLNPSPNYASTYIYSDDFALSGENGKIWSFGTEAYVGTINDVNSLIAANGKLLSSIAMTGEFSSNNHMTILLSVDDSKLKPTAKSEKLFSDIKDLAFEGSSYSYNSSKSDSSSGSYKRGPINWDKYYRKKRGLSSNIWPFFTFLITIFIILSFASMLYSLFGGIRNRNKVKYRGTPSYVVPYGADNLQIYYASTQVKLPRSKISSGGQGYLSSTLLRWIKDGYLLPFVPLNRKGEKDYKKTGLIIQKHPTEFNNQIEQRFWEALSEIALNSKENKITSAKVKRYFRRIPKEANEMIRDINKLAIERMISLGYIVKKGIFSLIFTQSGIKEAEALLAFEDYVKNYSLLAEREAYEAAVWDELLIAATACGYGEQALLQMRELVPEYQFAAEDLGSTYDVWDTIYLIRSIERLGDSLGLAVSSLDSSGSSTSSDGGGGFGSIGGGDSGFSGGGSGGGFR